MSKGINLALVGASGVVGSKIVSILEKKCTVLQIIFYAASKLA